MTAEADRFAADVLPIIREAQKAGAATLRGGTECPRCSNGTRGIVAREVYRERSGTVLKGKEFSAVAMDQAAAVNLPSASGFAQSRRLRMASSTSASACLACRASASATSARSSTAVNLSFWASIHDWACTLQLTFGGDDDEFTLRPLGGLSSHFGKPQFF